jgi:ABC-type iron transport system FetAB permease component
MIRLLLFWIFVAVYVVSYLIPKKIILREKISELFIANMIALVFAGIGYTIAVLLEGLEFSPVKNIVIAMAIIGGFLTGLSLSIAEHE